MSRPLLWAKACSKAREALEDLESLRQEYQDWRDNLPENLEQSATAEKLDAVVDLCIEEALSLVDEAENMDLPRGFGRD